MWSSLHVIQWSVESSYYKGPVSLSPRCIGAERPEPTYQYTSTSVHWICRRVNIVFTRDYGVVPAMLMQIPVFWDKTLYILVITRQCRRNLLLSFPTFHVPQNSKYIYTDCSSAATAHLEYTYHCWVGTLKRTMDSNSCIKEVSGR